jgi:beta-galactosidase
MCNDMTYQWHRFWDWHMPARNTFDPQRQAELIRFLQTAADAGLFVILRIGPYVCAEWSMGAMPVWLR